MSVVFIDMLARASACYNQSSMQQSTDYEELKEDQPVSRAQEKDWIGESSLINGGLAGLGLIIMQPFMYKGEFTGLPAKVCVIAFAISTPILAALVLLNHEESFRGHLSNSLIVVVAKSVAQTAAVVGFVASVWHIDPLAGKIAIASCIFAMAAHSAGYSKLYKFKK